MPCNPERYAFQFSLYPFYLTNSLTRKLNLSLQSYAIQSSLSNEFGKGFTTNLETFLGKNIETKSLCWRLRYDPQHFYDLMQNINLNGKCGLCTGSGVGRFIKAISNFVISFVQTC